jgi:hypothetical protein
MSAALKQQSRPASRYFGRVPVVVDAAAIVAELRAASHLWGQQKARLGGNSPHSETQDIWVRYRDVDAYIATYGANMSHFCDEHESVWLPPADFLPSAKQVALDLSAGFTLGGVLITTTPPGGCIAPHVDTGWHAEAHDKLYIALQVRPGARFCWQDGEINALDGEVYWFRNDVPHWVINDSNADRVGMIVCIR